MIDKIDLMFKEGLLDLGFTEMLASEIDIAEAKIMVYRALDNVLDTFPMASIRNLEEGICMIYDTDEENEKLWEVVDKLIVPSGNYLLKENRRFQVSGLAVELRLALKEKRRFNSKEHISRYNSEDYGTYSQSEDAAAKIYFKDREEMIKDLLSRTHKQKNIFTFDFGK